MRFFCQIDHQTGPREHLVTCSGSYQVSKTRYKGQQEPIPTLEIGQQSKEGIEDHPGRQNRQKVRFFVTLATKMPPLLNHW